MEEILLTNNIGVEYPSILYKYKSDPGFIHLKQLINERLIYLSTPDNLNDPLDMRFRISERLMKEEASKRNYGDALNEGIHHAIGFNDFRDKHSAHTNQYIRERGVLYCLSKHENNILMWSYYANSFEGYRLEFDFSNEQKVIKDCIFPVNYVPALPEVDHIEDAFDTTFTKLIDWEHEKECRIILIANEIGKSEFFKIQNSTLRNITFGYKVPKENIKEIIDLLFKNGMFHVSLHKISFDSVQFGKDLVYDGKPQNYLGKILGV